VSINAPYEPPLFRRIITRLGALTIAASDEVVFYDDSPGGATAYGRPRAHLRLLLTNYYGRLNAGD